jgi:phosphate transport system permease protein
MIAKSLPSRLIINALFKVVLFFFTFALLIPLIFILYYIFINGYKVINWEFLFNLPKPVGEIGGGVSNAILGSLLLIAIASILALPLGIFTGIFLAEKKDHFLAFWVKYGIDVLQGIPSIVVGMIAYLWFVLPMKSFSALAGGMALALIMLSIIIKGTEETLLLIPNSLKEASLALGVPYYRTILKVIVPAGMSSILSSILLSVARISGETAPLLFTAFGNPYFSVDPLKAVNSLPLLIFNYSTSPYPEWQSLAWGASLLLVSFVLFTGILARVIARKI